MTTFENLVCHRLPAVACRRSVDSHARYQMPRSAADANESQGTSDAPSCGRLDVADVRSSPPDLPKKVRFGDHPPSSLLKPTLHREVGEHRARDLVLSPESFVPRGSPALPQVVLRHVEKQGYFCEIVAAELAEAVEV